MTEPWSVRANLTTGGIARGGRLTLLEDGLSFANHALDRGLTGNAEWQAAYADVVEVAKQPRQLSFREVFSGGLRARLRVRTADGAEALIVVPDVDEAVMHIEQLRRAQG